MITRIFLRPLTILFALLITACTATPEKPAGVVAAMPCNDYPTRDRVGYVFNCIAKNGGLKFETQYACTCMIDKIAEKMTYQEYSQARTFTYLRSTPGEKGGVFRDPEQAKILRSKLKDAEQYADENCFVR